MQATVAKAYTETNGDPNAGTKYDFKRDLVGYGEKSFDPKWPNNAKVAISFVLNYEEGGERSLAYGDEFGEYTLATPCREKPGINRNFEAESEYDYGARAGVWRVLRLFKEFNYHLTAYVVGKAFDMNPPVAKAFVRDGHEIASHAYRWIPYDTVTPEVEKGLIMKQIETLKKACGITTLGWYMGRLSAQSQALIIEAHKEVGLPLTYISDNYADDVPYWTDVPQEKNLPDSEKKGLLYVPYNFDCNDFRFLSPCGWRSEEDYYQHLCNYFDTIYAEGGKMMTVGLHCRIIGKPGTIRALARFLEYISKKTGVWVATRSEIANHFKGKFPYKPGQLA